MVRISSSPADNPPGAVLTFKGCRKGAVRLAPVAVFVLPFGLAYGAAGKEAGLTVSEAVLTSALVFAGASQFAALDLLGTPATLVTLFLVMVAVNARHAVLGAALAPWLNQISTGKWLVACFLVSDANFTAARTAFRQGETDVGLLVGGGFVLWIVWVASTALGAGVGQAIGDMRLFGFDTVMVCFFAAAVTGELRAARSKQHTGLAVLIAGAVVFWVGDLLPAGWGIIAAAVSGGVCYWAVTRRA